jgi:hypothetical protein
MAMEQGQELVTPLYATYDEVKCPLQAQNNIQIFVFTKDQYQLVALNFFFYYCQTTNISVFVKEQLHATEAVSLSQNTLPLHYCVYRS